MANQAYVDSLLDKIKTIPKSLIDFDLPREKGRVPTQASSEFITNREQGDWAEEMLLKSINNNKDLEIIAIKYGKSEKRVSGEDGFSEFFLEYQDELDQIGKRPDLLIFKKDAYCIDWGYDISQFDREKLDKIVPLAIAGIEVRSSSFLYQTYYDSQEEDLKRRVEKIIKIKNNLISNYSDILMTKPGWLTIIESINQDNLSDVDFRTPSWSSPLRAKETSELIKELKGEITLTKKRNHLSITPKIEDIKVVTKWVQYYNVPHFYFQVFFDKIFGISFKKIIELLSDPMNNGVKYFIEADVKNQNKSTIKINPTLGFLVADKVDMPKPIGEKKELNRGRLLFYVTFAGGVAQIDRSTLLQNIEM